MNIKRVCVLLVIPAIVANTTASAGDRSAQFKLARAVPADCCVYVHSAHNPEREFLQKHWQGVLKALAATNIDQEIKTFVSGNLQTDEERAKFDERWEKAVKLCKDIKWGDLAANELAYFMRIESLPQFTILTRPDPSTLGANVKGLVAFLEELAGLSDDLAVTSSKANGAQIWTLGAGGVPMSLNLFHRDEVVGMSTSATTVNQVIDLLRGQGSEALVKSKRYLGAMADLPKPEDGMSFVDMQQVWKGIRSMVKVTADSDEEQKKWIDVINKVFDELDFVDYIASTEDTEGLSTFRHSVARLNETARSKKLCRAVVDQKPIGGFLKHVPKEATGFSVWSGADFEGAYTFVTGFVMQNFDEGPGWMTAWEEKQQEKGFHLQRDLLNLLDGPVLSMTMPPAVQTGMGGGDWVLLLKVRDGQKALASVNKQLERFSESMTISPAAEIEADGFRAVVHPMLAMGGMGQVIYGVTDEWFCISNSTAAVNQSLATAKGEAASFAKNERFLKEGLLPKGPVVAASFTDTSKMGQELAMGLSMMPMMGAFMPPEPGTEKARAMFMMLGKLAPAAAKLDFFRSTSSMCNFKGDRWSCESTSTYKKYEPPAEQPERQEKSKSELEGLQTKRPRARLARRHSPPQPRRALSDALRCRHAVR